MELGGQSIKIIKMINAINTEFGVTINTSDFYKLLTIDDLASEIKNQTWQTTMHKEADVIDRIVI